MSATDDWLRRFPQLEGLDDHARQRLASRSRRVSLPGGATVFAPGAPADHFLLVLEGTVRVQMVSRDGHEIVLYRVGGGESCVMTTACLLSAQSYDAEGVTESAVDAIAVPRATFDELMAGSAVFRRFVMVDYASRITSLLHVLEEVAFERVDRRLAQKLLAFCDATGELVATHQQLAVELGSAREVVSRQLKAFEKRGWLELARGRILLRDADSLERLARGEAPRPCASRGSEPAEGTGGDGAPRKDRSP
ncbi:MAG: Crp/Fnr family transcriptional regulator [Pseudomonadales bacterium]|jgi:CRP/FNR family transcriptional regulator|nr:Crp/Fnr family transcriptional regulator [Pseudomonadales bacterium]